MSEVIKISPYDITILPDRYRKDMGDIEELCTLIKGTKGNIVPIMVRHLDGKYILIAGERRTRACKLAGLEVNAIVMTDTAINDRECELLENLGRKDFTWQEKALAMKDLEEIIMAKHGTSTVRLVAKEANLSVGGVTVDLQLAKALDEAPDIFENCKTRESALKALQRYKNDEVMAELSLRKSKTNYGKRASGMVFNIDCLVGIKDLPKRSINGIISDPKYGIDIESVTKTDSQTGQPTNIYKEDSGEGYRKLMEQFAKDAEQIIMEDGFVAMFCGVQHYQWLNDLWRGYGFKMDNIPALWYRTGGSGQTMQPDYYFGRSYELLIYGVRGTGTLVRRGQSNVLQFQGINNMDKDHPLEKPLGLMEEIISRFCLPGSSILDFMCGSGKTLVAAIKLGCRAYGFEIEKRYYDVAIKNISDALKAKDAGLADNIK